MGSAISGIDGEQSLADGEEGLAWGLLGGADDDWDATVSAFADGGVEGDFAEEGNSLAGGFLFSASVAENFMTFTGGGDEIAHVFDHTEDRHLNFFEHPDAFPDHAEGGFLWGGDDHSSIERSGLAEGQLGITSSWRKVDEQIVQGAPFHSLEELLDGLHDHRAAPDDGGIAIDEEPDTHQLDAMAGGWDEFFIFADGGTFSDAHHERDAGSVDIAIEQADPGTEVSEAACEVDGAGGFADAAFAACDGDQALDTGNTGLVAPRRLRLCAGSSGRLFQFHHDVIHAGEGSEHLFALLFDLAACFLVWGGQFQGQADGSGIRDDVLYEAERHDVA